MIGNDLSVSFLREVSLIWCPGSTKVEPKNPWQSIHTYAKLWCLSVCSLFSFKMLSRSLFSYKQHIYILTVAEQTSLYNICPFMWWTTGPMDTWAESVPYLVIVNSYLVPSHPSQNDYQKTKTILSTNSVWQKNPLYISSWGIWKSVWKFLNKLKIAIPFDTMLPFLGLCPEESSRHMVGVPVHPSL